MYNTGGTISDSFYSLSRKSNSIIKIILSIFISNFHLQNYFYIKLKDKPKMSKWFNRIAFAIDFVLKLLFTFSYSEYFSLVDVILNIKYEYNFNSVASKKNSTLSFSSLFVNFIQLGIPSVFYALKLIDEWKNESSKSSFGGYDQLPPAPSNQGAAFKLESGCCAICRKTMVTPSALPSGYMFCYKCILTYCNETNNTVSCPVTSAEYPTLCIRRIFH